MPEVLVVGLAASATALATGLGAVPVFALGQRAVRLRPFLWGLAIGTMTVAAIEGLLLPALEEDRLWLVLAGLAVGTAFVLATRRTLGRRDIHVGRLRGAGVTSSVLVFCVLFVHSLPEGLAMGTAWASEQEGLGLFVVLAIALQNIPEGTSVAIPMDAAGFGARSQFWAAVGTSVPQPIGAVVAFVLVERIEALLPFSLAFAAGAMLALVLVELVPAAWSANRLGAAAGTATGAVVMAALAVVLAV